jgi:hypothetical protein
MDSDTSDSELSESNFDRKENHVHREFIRGAREGMQETNGGNVLFPGRHLYFEDSDTSHDEEEEID